MSKTPIYTGNGLIGQLQQVTPNLSATSYWSNSITVDSNGNMFYYGNNDPIITKTIEKLPTLLKIKKALLKYNKLRIEYELILNKYLPDTGSIYIPKFDLYCIFDKNDDKYWNNYVQLTYNEKELNKRNTSELTNTYCILLNDFDTKLDNNELIQLATISNYKDYAHEVLETLFYEEIEKTLQPKVTRNKIHKQLDDKFKM